MWHIENPELQLVILDFSSSGQERFQATRLVFDGVELMNGLELIEWEEDKTQILICDYCGAIGCSPGGWIAFRSCGNLILLMPAFEAMRADDWSRTEFSPPYFVANKGTAYFERQTWESLRRRFSSFPPFENIRPLQMREAMWLAQYCAPLQILGEPATLDINHRKFDHVIGATEGEPEEHLRRAECLLRENFENQSPACLSPLLQDEESVWLFLDAAEFIAWQAMAVRDGKYRFVINDAFIIDEGAS